MAHTKSFVILTALCISNAWAYDVRIPVSATAGVRTDYTAPTSIVDVIFNVGKSIAGRLSAEDKETHIETVLFAMTNLDNGEIAQWHNTRDKTSGRIKIVITRPVQGGYCRQFFTEINLDGRVRQYNEEGCRTIDSQFWTFSGR